MHILKLIATMGSFICAGNIVCMQDQLIFAKKLTRTNFGTQAADYTVGRKPYPLAVFSFLKSLFPADWLIVDLGCGNGRATLGLAEAGFSNVIGYDMDKLMLAEAQKRAEASRYNINFINDDVKNLQAHFSVGQVKLITACTSLHIYGTPENFDTLRSILDPNGFLVVVRCPKDKTNELRDACQKLIEKELGYLIDTNRKGTDTSKLLRDNKFNIVYNLLFAASETYDCLQMKARMKSNSIWTELSAAEKKRLQPIFDAFVEEKMKGGPVTLVNTYECVVAQPVLLSDNVKRVQ